MNLAEIITAISFWCIAKYNANGINNLWENSIKCKQQTLACIVNMENHNHTYSEVWIDVKPAMKCFQDNLQ